MTITASGMENMEPMEISYDDEEEKEPIYGKGGKIRGYGTGNQKNSVKISLLREDFNEMCRVIQSKGYKNFYKYVIPKIVVNYADEGAATCTDVLTNVVLSKRSFKAAQGDKLSCQESDIGDWKIAKCIEYSTLGMESPYDLQELHKQRQVIRDEIGALEEELAKCEDEDEAASEK